MFLNNVDRVRSGRMKALKAAQSLDVRFFFFFKTVDEITGMFGLVLSYQNKGIFKIS